MRESLDVFLDDHSTCFQDQHASSPLDLGMSNSPVAYRTVCTNMLGRTNQTIMEIVCGPTSGPLAYYFISFS